MRQRLPAGSPLVVLGLAVAGVTAYVLTYALDATAYLNDEYGSVISGRAMARDPGEIVSASAAGLSRGPERLTSVVLALPDAIFSGAPAQMRAGHILLALAYALVAVPAYALLRGLEVPRWPAVAIATTTLMGPWIVFGTTFLNVSLAAPLTVGFAWAAWRAVVRPTIAAEVVAVLLAGLMTTARAGHALFFAAAVLAAVAAAWWTRAPGDRLSRFPMQVLRRTPVISAVTLLAGVVLLVLGPSRLAGDAYEASARFTFPADQIAASLGWTTAVLAIATGFVALPIGGAWALRQLVRPADVRTGAFAVIGLTMFVAFVYVAGAVTAEEQERYPAVLAAFPLVAFGAALFRREVSVVGTVVVGLLSARAIAMEAVEQNAEPLNYVFAPAELFFAKVVVGRLTVALPYDEHMVTIATLGVAVIAVAVAALCARRLVAAGAVAAVLVLGALAGAYTLHKYEPATAPGDLDAMAWLDDAVGGEDAVIWNYQWAANAADRDVYTRRTLYHNASACCGEWRPDPRLFLRPDGQLERDPPPRYVAGPGGYRPVAFAAKLTSRPEPFGFGMRVERFVGDSPRAAALVVGAAEDGAVEDEPARIVAFSALRGRCLDVEVTNRAEAQGAIGFVVGERRGTLAPGSGRWLRLRGSAAVRRTRGADAPLVLEEMRYVDCDAPPPA